MEAPISHQFIGDELKSLYQKIEEVKRDNWSLSDETIEAYLIGKGKGAEELVNSVLKSYLDNLNKIQLSVETIYSSLNGQSVECQKAYLKIRGLDFKVIFVISDTDFHDREKKKLCYKVSQEEIRRLTDKNLLITYGFTCAEDLDVNSLTLSGYNATFG